MKFTPKLPRDPNYRGEGQMAALWLAAAAGNIDWSGVRQPMPGGRECFDPRVRLTSGPPAKKPGVYLDRKRRPRV